MNAIPMLRAKASTYEGRAVFTADAVAPVWSCGTCDTIYSTQMMGDACCSSSPKYESVNDSKVDRISWEEFRESGMLWLVNRSLHLFGLAIVLTVDRNAEDRVVDAFPARVPFLGFGRADEEAGFAKVRAAFLRSNVQPDRRAARHQDAMSYRVEFVMDGEPSRWLGSERTRPRERSTRFVACN